MKEDAVYRLRVEMQAGSRTHLLRLLDAQAAQFFGEEPYRLVGHVDVDVETVETVAGKTVQLAWVGTAYFESAR